MIVIKSFYLNNKDSYTIDCSLNRPLELTDTNKEYYLQLNQISFVNCVANITEDLKIPVGEWFINGILIKPKIIIEGGSLYSLSEIYSKLNDYIASQIDFPSITFELDEVNAKCVVKMSDRVVSVNIPVRNSLLSSQFFGFDDDLIINDISKEYSSTKSINVSEDNQFGLFSNITNSNSFINNGSDIIESTLIWTDNLISDRYGTISLKANIPIYFKLNNSFLQNFKFAIKKLDSTDFSLVKNVSTDFFISFNIVERLK